MTPIILLISYTKTLKNIYHTKSDNKNNIREYLFKKGY